MRRARSLLLVLPVACSLSPLACGDDGGGGESEGATTSAGSEGESTGAAETGEASEGGSAGTDGGSDTSGATDMTETTGDSETDATTGALDPCQDGSGACPPVVIMGYWPPTNEMLRQWSQNPEQNLGEWQGKNWEGYGYDIYAFFPEFPPDGDPSNDPIGSPGSVGAEGSDLQVDYQDTSSDFWRIIDEYEPVILVTTSRGGMIGWEVEALEGGHADPDNPDPESPPEFDWISDQYGDVTHPTMDSVDPRSWDAISTYRQGETLDTQLPAEAIVDAVSQLGLGSVQIEYGTSGRYLSGFLGLHGLYYNSVSETNLVAGHIHVGREVPNEDARAMIEETMRVVLSEVER